MVALRSRAERGLKRQNQWRRRHAFSVALRSRAERGLKLCKLIGNPLAQPDESPVLVKIKPLDRLRRGNRTAADCVAKESAQRSKPSVCRVKDSGPLRPPFFTA